MGLTAFLYNFPGASASAAARYDPDTEWTGSPLPNLRNLLNMTR